jgi:hypothetical protein
MLDNKKILEKKMKRFGKMVVLSLTIAGFLLAVTAAKADSLTITLAQPYQSIALNGTLDFTATATNTSGSTVNLSGDDYNLGAPLSVDDTPYLANWPLSLGAGDSYTGLLFSVDIPVLTPQTIYEGIFEITDENNDVVGSADFNVAVITPEPSSLSLLGVGLFAGLVWLGGVPRRRQVSRVA